MHETTMPMNKKKMENKVKGFNVRILDDGTFMMRTDNMNYEMCKEYSFKNMKELHKGMKEIMDKMDNHSMKDDALEMKKEY